MIFSWLKTKKIKTDNIETKTLTLTGSMQIKIGNCLYTVGTEEIEGKRVLTINPE